MTPRQILPTGITASALAHLSVLMLVLFFADVHPFASVTAEAITVDIVSPAEAPPAPKTEEPPLPESKANPTEAVDIAAKAEVASPPPPADPQPSPSPPSPTTERSESPPNMQNASTRPQQAAKTPAPAYIPPEPDLSIKYHVMLGLPPDLPAEPSRGKSGGDFDAQASKAADVNASLVAEFRRHLRTCSKLPESVAPDDQLRITLRVLMTPDGRLAAEPILIEASASTKGPALMQSAIRALRACQPYGMLPADRYGEWKSLDLDFTPKNF
jgi:outer membrane biosynthesis protein TonB